MKIHIAGDGHDLTNTPFKTKLRNLLISFYYLNKAPTGMPHNRIQFVKELRKEHQHEDR